MLKKTSHLLVSLKEFDKSNSKIGKLKLQNSLTQTPEFANSNSRIHKNQNSYNSNPEIGKHRLQNLNSTLEFTSFADLAEGEIACSVLADFVGCIQNADKW